MFAFGWKSTYQSKILKFNVSFALLLDNFDGYWPVIHYRGIVVMVAIAKNLVSDAYFKERGHSFLNGRKPASRNDFLVIARMACAPDTLNCIKRLRACGEQNQNRTTETATNLPRQVD